MNVQKRRQYTDEFRRDAANLVLLQGYKASEAASNLDPATAAGVGAENRRRVTAGKVVP